MLGFTPSRDGLLQIEDDLLSSLVQKEPISGVYDLDKTPLGRGKYATVWRAVHKKTGTAYAAKFVKKRRRNQDQMKEIIHEIAVLMQCKSTNRVIRLHEVYESVTEMVLVLELAAGGELQHILDGGQCLGEVEARKAMKQILEGVAYLHDRNIAHLDLKPQNLLLSVQDCCDDIKLCDFGISKVLMPGVAVREILGTADYVAPEVLSYEPIGLSTDIWSVGVLAYVLLSGYSPFGADDRQQTFLNISKCSLSFEPEHFEDVSSAAIDFIKSALIVDPRTRPSIHDMLDHPWISLKTNIPPALTLKPCDHQNNQSNNLTPKSTPITQRKSFSCINDTTAKSPGQRKNTFCTDTLNGSFTDSSPVQSESEDDICVSEDCTNQFNSNYRTSLKQFDSTVEDDVYYLDPQSKHEIYFSSTIDYCKEQFYSITDNHVSLKEEACLEEDSLDQTNPKAEYIVENYVNECGSQENSLNQIYSTVENTISKSDSKSEGVSLVDIDTTTENCGNERELNSKVSDNFISKMENSRSELDTTVGNLTNYDSATELSSNHRDSIVKNDENDHSHSKESEDYFVSNLKDLGCQIDYKVENCINECDSKPEISLEDTGTITDYCDNESEKHVCLQDLCNQINSTVENSKNEYDLNSKVLVDYFNSKTEHSYNQIDSTVTDFINKCDSKHEIFEDHPDITLDTCENQRDLNCQRSEDCFDSNVEDLCSQIESKANDSINKCDIKLSLGHADTSLGNCENERDLSSKVPKDFVNLTDSPIEKCDSITVHFLDQIDSSVEEDCGNGFDLNSNEFEDQFIPRPEDSLDQIDNIVRNSESEFDLKSENYLDQNDLTVENSTYDFERTNDLNQFDSRLENSLKYDSAAEAKFPKCDCGSGYCTINFGSTTEIIERHQCITQVDFTTSKKCQCQAEDTVADDFKEPFDSTKNSLIQINPTSDSYVDDFDSTITDFVHEFDSLAQDCINQFDSAAEDYVHEFECLVEDSLYQFDLNSLFDESVTNRVDEVDSNTEGSSQQFEFIKSKKSVTIV